MFTPIQKKLREQRQEIQNLSETVLMKTWWMRTLDDLELIWAGVRSSHWSVQEEMNNKLEWLTSRMIFYSWTRKNEKFKSIESFVQSEHILEDFMRFIPSLRYRFSELYNRWPSWNLDKNEGLVKLVEERVQSCSEDEARDIWKRWASTAKEFGITLDSESIYGEKFLPLYDLSNV